MRHICAWCKKETAPPDGAANDNLISHGMCDECSKLFMAGIEATDIRAQSPEIRIMD